MRFYCNDVYALTYDFIEYEIRVFLFFMINKKIKHVKVFRNIFIHT